MSLWTKAQQLQGDALQQVRAVYGEHFPLEVRHFLAQWLEEKMWPELESENPQQFDSFAPLLFNTLIQELETRAETLSHDDHFIAKIKLVEAANNFRQRYSHNPSSLFRVIKHCLTTEYRLVQQAEDMGSMGMSSGMMLGCPASSEILQQLEMLKGRTQETADDLRKMEQDQEAFTIQYHECTKLNANLSNLQNHSSANVHGTNPNQGNVEVIMKLIKQKEVYSQILQQKMSALIQNRISLSEKLKITLGHITAVQTRILDEVLIKWKRDQQLAGNGAPFNNILDTIQEWCETLAEINWLNRQQIKEAERLKVKLPLDSQVADILPQLNSQVTQLLSALVTSTFVIEKQPPQVMKTNTRFTATVRLLVGGKLNVHMTPPHVKVSIISEPQANALLKNEKISKGDVSGDILNNTGTMEYIAATRQLAVTFRNMQLKKIKRTEKKGTESVMDEKFSLLFSSQFSVGGGELVFQVWTLSLPVVVIVHGNQEPHAWATVTWDNAFAEPGRVPFLIPDKVPWPRVAEALSIKFKSHTGRALNESSLCFLADKVFRLNGPADYNMLVLTWSQFCKEALPERTFTFWEWFYAVMKLTREHLKGPWVDGLVIGFIRKKQAEEMLSATSNGTFLLRFSDSELGGVTIAWTSCTEDSKTPAVFMLLPFTSKDFAIRSLADRISDLPHLVYLYPDVPKHQAFSKYYTPFNDSQIQPPNGYVKSVLVTKIPGSRFDNNSQNAIFQPRSPDTASLSDSVSSTMAEAEYNDIFLSNEFPQLDEVSLELSFSDFIQAYTKPQ